MVGVERQESIFCGKPPKFLLSQLLLPLVFGQRFLVRSSDVLFDALGIEEASDGESSDAGIVDV